MIEPEGLLYIPEFLSKAEQVSLIEGLAGLDSDWKGAFKRRGMIVRCREIDFLHDYGRNSRRLSAGPALPAFLSPARERCAQELGHAPDEFGQVIVSLYRPDAHIDWHTDSVHAFGDTICGLSLAASCTMMFRRRGAPDARWAIVLAPGSLLVLRGPARYDFEHPIPPVKQLRYSITMRTLRR